ncbi:low temperature requirement protein A [Pseudoxanthomonas japonensis]|nr:low temperature requirement protein A [Pseudoxanthomonas japonensis]
METNGSWLRTRGQRDSGKVSMTELFFDLVFVFAVTQLSHTLLEHLDLGGFLRTSVLFLAVWWLWIFTSWCTNWLNPDTTAVRLLLFALMLGGLVLSSSIPQAFGAAGLAFGLLFAIMQVGRSLFMVRAFRGHPEQRDNFLRMSLWLLLSGAFWLAGGMLEGEQRLICWIIALGIEYLAPALYFQVPGLGRSRTSDWDVDGAHLAERCMLFVIIALGESLLVTGATFAGLALTPVTMAAFLAAFLGSVAMWWVYFDSGAEHASHRIAHSEDPGRLARVAYTYTHLLIVAGIIVCAVADELVLVHPEHASPAGIVAILGGPVLYLSGNALFKWLTSERRFPPLSHLTGLVLLALMGGWAALAHPSALSLGIGTTLVMMMVAIWETRALRKGRMRGQASEA